MARPRNLLLRLIAIAFGLLLAAVAAEIGLRISGWPGTPLESGRLETHHRSPPSRPDFRDRGNALATDKTPGARRVVVVGDSFTWGAGVLAQDAYPDRMQETLVRRGRHGGAEEPVRRRERRARKQAGVVLEEMDEAEGESEGASSTDEAVAGEVEGVEADSAKREPAVVETAPPIEVVNFSRPGWNTPMELGALRRAIDQLAPDVIVLGYCLNDSEPTRKTELARMREGVFPAAPDSAWSKWVYARSALYRVAFQRADNFRMRQATTRYYHRLYEDDQPSWQATRRALGEMQALAASRGIPFLLVVFPIFDSQLDDRYHYRALHEKMAATARELGIDQVDLMPRYVGIDARRLAIDPFLDAHPSELAHRIAADALVEELDARGLLR